jgi:hypothetical protein
MMMVDQTQSSLVAVLVAETELFLVVVLQEHQVVEEEFNGVRQDLDLVADRDHKEILADQAHHYSSHQTPQEAAAEVGLVVVVLVEILAVLVVMVVTKRRFGHPLTLERLVLQEPMVTSLEVAVAETSEIILEELEALVAGAVAVKAVKQMAARTPTEMQQLQDLAAAVVVITLVLVPLVRFTLDTQHLNNHGKRLSN